VVQEDGPPNVRDPSEADARRRLSAMSDAEIADRLIEIWAETPLHTITSWVLSEAVNRLKGGPR
jgi:hypothetical protein